MEPVAAQKVLEDMIQDRTGIGMFVSDRCSNIGKVIREVGEKYMVNIDLEFDVWDLVKSEQEKKADTLKKKMLMY